MAIIKGIIETVRELHPKTISFGNMPSIYQNESQVWQSDDSSIILIETTLGELMDQELKNNDKQFIKRS